MKQLLFRGCQKEGHFRVWGGVQHWFIKIEKITKNENINQKLSQLKNELETISENEKKLEEDVKGYIEALARSQRDYTSLKNKSSEYLNIKTSYNLIQKELKELDKENRALRDSQRNKWFATGALILLCGLMIGLLVGRQEKKRKPYY